MTPETHILLKSSVQYLSTVFSLITNVFLIFLILTKSPKQMGTYKSLMLYFSSFSIFFTCLDCVTEPYGHTYGYAFLVIMKTEDSIIDTQIAFFLICLLFGCFGFTITIIAIHFIFRMFALERKGRLRYFKRKYLPIWFTVPVLIGVNHTLNCFFAFKPNQKLSDYVRESVRKTYRLDINKQTYAGGYFFPPNASGTPELDWKVGISFINLTCFAALSFSILTYCGTRSYLKVKTLILDGNSTFAVNLQKQLYKSLVIQASIPILFMFIPIAVFTTAPYFCADVTWMSQVATVTYALYPAIDPIPIIFIVDSYRRATIDIFKCKLFLKPKIQPSKEEASQTISANNMELQN